jgi:tetratricopeptide (TPR) repeat protein
MRIKFLRLCLISIAVLTVEPGANADDDGRANPKLDPKRIINESMNFLKEREPDMTAEENALYEKANQLMDQKPDYALKLLESIGSESSAKEPASPAFELLLGNAYYASGAHEKAEVRYLNAAKRYPSFLRAWTNLGVLYYAQGQYKKAIPCFAKSVTLGGRESAIFGMMGFCLETTGDAIAAEVAYVQALSGDPGNVDWMEGLLRVYQDAKQYPRAEVMVRNLIKERPKETKYWLTYSNIMLATNRKLEAIALLEQTISAGIAGESELTELAGLYADEELIPEAMQAYGKIKVTVSALGERKALQLVRILTACSEWEKARLLLDEIRPKLDPKGQEAYLLVEADLLSAQKKWDAARKVLDGLLKLAPMNGDALVSLGRAYKAEGDEAHAVLVFEAAAQTEAGARPACIELANIELKNRHYERSVSFLEKVLRIEKNRDIEDILTRVRTLVPNAGPSGT